PGDEWIFVTDPNSGANGRSLYLIHHQNDTKVDGYTADGSNKMTIFGFGRTANQRQLTGLPQQFTFGFTDETTVGAVAPVVNDAYKPLAVTGANDSGGEPPPPDPECLPLSQDFYLSPKKNIVVSGIAVADEDVAKYDGQTCEWSLFFDGSAAGLPTTANIDALGILGSDLYMSFVASTTTVPGIAAKVDDSDVVKFSGGVF